jgi:transposase-like protein
VEPAAPTPEDQQRAEELVKRAHEEGVELVGPGGLRAGLTKKVLEASVEAETSQHIGHDRAGPGRPRERFELCQRHPLQQLLADVGQSARNRRQDVSGACPGVYPVVFIDALIVKVREGTCWRQQ